MITGKEILKIALSQHDKLIDQASDLHREIKHGLYVLELAKQFQKSKPQEADLFNSEIEGLNGLIIDLQTRLDDRDRSINIITDFIAKL